MAYHLLRGLKTYHNIQLSAILLTEGRLAEEIRKLGVEVHVVDERKTSFFNILLTIRNILRKWPPDLIHSHRYKENILAYLISRFVRRVRLIGTQHGMPEVHGGKSSLRQRLIIKWNFFVLSRCFHHSVAVSRDIKATFVKQYGFKKKKISVIHNGMDIPHISPNRHKAEPFVIGSSGRLFPVKDYPFMVEIAKVVREKKSRVHFQLAGDGPERPKLQAVIEQYGLDNGAFVLKGHLENMSAFYQGMDLYLNTSIHEGVPMSVLEAMAHGLPVIAPKVGGFPEIIDDGVEGYLITERNPKAFAEKCLLLYRNKALRQEMSMAARKKVVQSFSIENMAEQYYSLYLKVASNR